MANPKASRAQLADENNNPMITAQQALSTAAVVAHSLTDADASLGATTQAEIEAVLDALGTATNALRTAMIAHGLMADA